MPQAYVSAELRRVVRERARDRCEYCLLPEACSFFPHQFDHVVAQQHGGETIETNLCLACVTCNKYKGTNLTSIDPATGNIEPLFHPREHRWTDHFQINDGLIEPLSATGRATARLLRFNAAARITERSLLLAAGLLLPPQ